MSGAVLRTEYSNCQIVNLTVESIMTKQIGINKLTDPILQWIWRSRADGVEGFFLTRFIKQAVRIAIAIGRDLKDGQLSMRAMSLVYTTVIAVVPLLALSFSVLKGFGMHQRVEPALLDALVDIGDKRYEIVSTIMGFIDNVNIGVLGSIGFAILIFSVISMMQKIEGAFNHAWQVRRARAMGQRFRDYLSVIFVGPLLIMLSTAITASFNTSIVTDYFMVLPMGGTIMSLFGELLPFFMMSLGFALAYMFLPNTRVTLIAALVGGMVTTVFWKIMGWGVSNFVANSASHIAIYSAFASIIILMVWLYLGWLVLLTGASVAFYFQNPRFLRHAKSEQVVSASIREKLALNIIYLIAIQFKQGGDSWSANALALKLETPEFIVDELIAELVELGYIFKNQEEDSVHLAKSTDAIEIPQVIEQIRSAHAAGNKRVQSNLDSVVVNCFEDLGKEKQAQYSVDNLLEHRAEN